MTTPTFKDAIVHRTDVPPLILIGVDHRSAPIELREKVAYGAEEGQEVLQRLIAADEIAEACLLTTCNRTELYLLPRKEDAYRLGFETVFLSRAAEIEREGRFYVKRDLEAARHLLEVASGLQSMILGEPEILGQVKRAAGWADGVGASGPVIQRLLRTAIGAGGRARSETEVSTGAVSFGFAVVDLARNIFQRLEDCSVLILGAGETARQVARSLLEKGARELVVANRSPERAAEFLELFPGARSVPFDDRREALALGDVIVASTGADEPIVTRPDLERAMESRKDRPLLVADLGVPRNVDPAARKIDNLFLQDIASLDNLISRNLKRRREEIPRVHEILDRELAHFTTWYRGLAAEPLIAQLQKKAEQIRRMELRDAHRRFPAETHEHLDRLTRSLVRKILHHPSHHLRSAAASEFDKLELVRELFKLGEDE